LTSALPFLSRGALCGSLASACLLPVGGCGGTAQDSGDGDGDAGDGDGDNGVPGSLNPDDLLVDLDTEELGIICDTVADFYGGYGVTYDCADGLSVSSTESKAACIAGSTDLPSTCIATVDDTLSCGEGLAESCSFTATGCLALLTCVN
jgi:hypothetical protein